ncbi:DUF6221 family protein [Streptomyces sp. NPDC018947]|uniref:DUF6221 family protein n=1 Tax=Streptomyces sp. NPDC018947 TaxID=3365054 RepID=UPI0037BD0B3E
MDELVVWLRDQLDRDEQIAYAVDDSLGEVDLTWKYEPEDELGGKVVTTRGADVIYDVTTGVGEHVAEHSPRRVLCEIQNDREMLRQYERLLRAQARHAEAQAELAADFERHEHTGSWEGPGDPESRARALRREADYLPAMLVVMEGWVRRKAAVYADRPGYSEDWRP